jgi:hypothetical protein
VTKCHPYPSGHQPICAITRRWYQNSAPSVARRKKTTGDALDAIGREKPLGLDDADGQDRG